jgi:hypothetical protein
MKYTPTLIKNTIIGNPPACHTFNPVSATTIVPVNKEIDGKIRKYFGYMSNVRGSEISLYYTDDLEKEWIPYSKNHILSSPEPNFRWPSTVYENGVFHMFLDNNKDSRLERWESTDGINFKSSEIIHTENKWWGNYNPFIWKNPNDNTWYLYWRNSTTNEIRVDIGKDIRNLNDRRIVINQKESFPSFTASPSVLYKDGIYYLLMEGEIDKVWKTFLFTSKSPVSGFIRPIEILVNGDACGMHYFNEDKSKIYLFISNYSGNGWKEYTYNVEIT